MNSNVRIIVIAVIALALGLFVGRWMGAAEVYKKTSGDLSEQYYRGVSANLKSHLALLQLHDNHKEREAAQQLERLVNVDILALKRLSMDRMKLPPEGQALVKQAEEYTQRQRPDASKK